MNPLRSTLLVCCAAACVARADVTLPAIFSDHVVLQRDAPLPVWGWAAPGEQVEVALGSQRATATAAADGKWLVRLAAQPLAKDPLTLTVKGNNRLEAADVLLGDLWLCSGQSNMDFLENKQWFWAEAVIDGDTVLVRSPQVQQPVAVRYAYSSNPTGANLYNRAGLPASPFRSDDW